MVAGAYSPAAHRFKLGYTGFIKELYNYNYPTTTDGSYTFRTGLRSR